jgi:hypothetical protein
MKSVFRLSRYKDVACNVSTCILKAEGEGFEPPVGCPTAVFKTAALVHSAIPPGFLFGPVRARAFYHAEIGVSKVRVFCRLPDLIVAQFSPFTIGIIMFSDLETCIFR